MSQAEATPPNTSVLLGARPGTYVLEVPAECYPMLLSDLAGAQKTRDRVARNKKPPKHLDRHQKPGRPKLGRRKVHVEYRVIREPIESS